MNAPEKTEDWIDGYELSKISWDGDVIKSFVVNGIKYTLDKDLSK